MLKCNHYNQLYVFRPCASVQYLEINVSKWRINSPRMMKSLMKRQMLFLIFSLKRGSYLSERCKYKVVLISIAEGYSLISNIIKNEQDAIKTSRKNNNNNMDLLVPPPSGPLTRWAIVRANRTRFDAWFWWQCLSMDDVTHYKDYKVWKSVKPTSRLWKVPFWNIAFCPKQY